MTPRLGFLLLLTFSAFLKCAYGYSLTINMQEFSNPDYKEMNGHCCDSHETWGCNIVPCDFKFRFCIEPMQEGTPDLDRCFTSWVDTGLVDSNVATFHFKSKTYGAWRNPHTVIVDKPWEGFYFKMQAIDDDPKIYKPDDPIDNVLWTFDLAKVMDVQYNISTKNPRKNGAGPTYTKFTFKASTTITTTTTPATLPPSDSITCAELYKAGNTTSGRYDLEVALTSGKQKFKAYCDMETDGGGWTVIQRQKSHNTLFNATWAQYEQGFYDDPNLGGNHWLGNKYINWLTEAEGMGLRVDLTDCHNKKSYTYYPNFKVGDASTNYRLTISEGAAVTGDAGNSLSYPNVTISQNGAEFSTVDRDHDKLAGAHCTTYYPGGWWFNECGVSNLNGKYYEFCEYTSAFDDGIFWFTWKRGQGKYSAKTVEMKVRRNDYQ